MTLEICASTCTGQGTFFAVQNGESCACGNASGTTQVDEEQCNVPCGGDSNVFCGGVTSFAVYGPEGPDVEEPENPDPTDPPEEASPVIVGNYNRLGCYLSTGPNGPLLSGDPTVDPLLTLQTCATTCEGSRYFGATEGNTCFCGDEINNPDSGPGPDTECASPCGGDPTVFCGGVERVALYDRGSELRPAVVGPYFRRGCRVTSGLTEFARSTTTDDMTLQVCATFCDGLQYFGVLDGQTCLCDDDTLNATDIADEEECSVSCVGNPDQYCGGDTEMALYDMGEPPEEEDPDDGEGGEGGEEQGDARPPVVGPFKRVGCQTYSTDVEEDPTFDGQDFEEFDMSLDLCAELCTDFRYFATYFRFRCACRNELRGNSMLVPEAECDQTCLGNMTQICSGNRRLVVYDKEAEVVTPTSTIIASSSTVVTEPTGEATTFLLSIGDDDIDLPSGGEEAPTSPPIRRVVRSFWKRQNEDLLLVGDSGPVGIDQCDTATRFTLVNGAGGRLESNGASVRTGQDITFIGLSPLDVPANGLVDTGFALVGDELVWLNPTFFGGRAGFCLDDANTLFATFTDPDGTDYPLNCVATTLRAVPTAFVDAALYAAFDGSLFPTAFHDSLFPTAFHDSLISTTFYDSLISTTFDGSLISATFDGSFVSATFSGSLFSTTFDGSLVFATFDGALISSSLGSALHPIFGPALVPSIPGTIIPIFHHSVSGAFRGAIGRSLRCFVGHLVSTSVFYPFNPPVGAAIFPSITTAVLPLFLLRGLLCPAIGGPICRAICVWVATGLTVRFTPGHNTHNTASFGLGLSVYLFDADGTRIRPSFIFVLLHRCQRRIWHGDQDGKPDIEAQQYQHRERDWWRLSPAGAGQRPHYDDDEDGDDYQVHSCGRHADAASGALPRTYGTIHAASGGGGRVQNRDGVVDRR
ncbi:hypothetical protein ACHAQA_006755 [Verticillium albo-atrum]